MAASSKVVRARTSFVAPGRRVVHEGDLFDASDPVVKGREELFEDAVQHIAARQSAAKPPARKASAR